VNILLIGSGGREHALAWKISQSSKVTKLYIAPGNGGTKDVGENVQLDVSDFAQVKRFVQQQAIEMLVVGPEQPLVDGLADKFSSDSDLTDVLFIGPGKEGAMLEGSKDVAKSFMKKNKIPTAAYQTFTKGQEAEAKSFLKTLNAPYVLKADGLAAGKGVLILDALEEAETAIDDMFQGKFGDAGQKVVIEEFLSGIELSVFVLTDGKDYVILPEAKDYKRVGEGDTGLNTGGMGAVSPVGFADNNFLQKVEERIIQPSIKGLKEESIPYVGFLFIGLMNVAGDPYVIEYNVRMGDPETEVVIPRIASDLVEVLEAAGRKQLANYQLEIDPRAAATVMMVSGGYPEAYEKGKAITGIEHTQGSLLFHAGTKYDTDKNQLVTSGGRVIAITSLGENFEEALQLSYQNVERVKFEGNYYRKDIGKDLQS
jgi:phosphoribosylamine--glycine ligase